AGRGQRRARGTAASVLGAPAVPARGWRSVASPSALLILVAWLFREALFAGGVFYVRDIHLVWVPQAEAFARAIAAGSWPVWDDGLGFGQPLLADPSAQALYPPTWLGLAFRPWTCYTP